MTPEELARAGIGVDDAAYARLAAFVRALLDENSRLNLTAIRTEPEAWALHVCDSLALLPLIDAAGSSAVLDIGTGGGAPGLPIACARPNLRVTLLDATRKKTDAVRRIIGAIGVANATVAWGRAEVLGATPEYRGRFDSITAKAVASLDRLLAYAAPFLRPGGRAWFFKTQDAKDEIAQAAATSRRLGFRAAPPWPYVLPGEHGGRMIVRYTLDRRRA